MLDRLYLSAGLGMPWECIPLDSLEEAGERDVWVSLSLDCYPCDLNPDKRKQNKKFSSVPAVYYENFLGVLSFLFFFACGVLSFIYFCQPFNPSKVAFQNICF